MVRSDFKHYGSYLLTIPFSLTDDLKLWKDFKTTGSFFALKRANGKITLPIIADNTVDRAGILLPSYRNQLA